MQYLSILLNILLIAYLIIDRVYRLRAIKEYKEAKDAQISLLQQQLEIERRNNDIELSEMHKKRYENVRQLLDEKQDELKILEGLLDQMKVEIDKKGELAEWLLAESNKTALAKHNLESKIRALEEGEPHNHERLRRNSLQGPGA